jgi:catechol 2,3-dioxygenase-like lactoylglutathione lyase family enzyme
MKRLHVHILVDSLADSVRFYSGMFGAEPTVMKSDYAKWMLEDPRVNFAISRRGAEVRLNHLGIQVESASELGEMQSRLVALQSDVVQEQDAACCYAKSDKYWVTDPSGIAWETFHTLDSIPIFGEPNKTAPAQEACCIPLAKPRIRMTADGPCCVPSTSAKQGSTCC